MSLCAFLLLLLLLLVRHSSRELHSYTDVPTLPIHMATITPVFFNEAETCSGPVEAQTCHLLMYIRHVKWNVILNIHLTILPADVQLIGCVHMLCTVNKRQCADLYTAHDRCGLYGCTAATAGEKIKRALRFIQVLNGVWILCDSSGYIFMGDIS